MESLTQGQVRARPPRNRSQAFSGIEPLSAISYRSQKFQPLPDPLGPPPYHYDLETALPGIGKKAKKRGKISFHVVGDTGGILSPEPQRNVANSMRADLDRKEPPAFFYHLGDIVYNNGQIADYYAQFYDPYEQYDAPIIAIPGNHDGDPASAHQVSLDGFVRYFMTSAPQVNPESQDAPRVTMSLPNPYFTLVCPFATIVGLYTNVPEHGSIDSVQQQWLANELASAPDDKALIVASHHPVYSFDNHHSGSPRIADALEHAINDSRRVPNLVLAAHVHNYQRIERTLASKVPMPFVVAGNGGFYQLHSLNVDGSRFPVEDTATGARLIVANEHNHGYLTLTIDGKFISGTVTTIEDGRHAGNPEFDKFFYTVKPQHLPPGARITL